MATLRLVAELRLGASAVEPCLAGVLPERAVCDAPVERAPGPSLRDSDCRCYRVSGELVVYVAHFRLRFDDSGRVGAQERDPASRPVPTPLHR